MEGEMVISSGDWVLYNNESVCEKSMAQNCHTSKLKRCSENEE
jgi:hypothetical protein